MSPPQTVADGEKHPCAASLMQAWTASNLASTGSLGKKSVMHDPHALAAVPVNRREEWDHQHNSLARHVS